MRDRIIGYTVICTIILLLVLPVGYLVWQSATPKVERTILFKSVKGLSFLSIQDPVRILGVEVGTVTAITYKNGVAKVTIKTKSSVKVYRNFTVQVLAKGVMGERFFTIDAGTSSAGEVPLDEPLYGTVSVGPDEALSYIGLLADAIHELTLLSEQLRHGTKEKKSLIVQVWNISTAIDTLVTGLQTLLTTTGSTLPQHIEHMTTLLSEADSYVQTVADSLPAATIAIEQLITDMHKLITGLEPIIAKSDLFLRTLDASDHPLWKPYQLSLKKNLQELRDLINLIADDSLSIPVRLW